jgi:hypothetical protein
MPDDIGPVSGLPDGFDRVGWRRFSRQIDPPEVRHAL